MLAAVAAFFERSRADVLSFPMAMECARESGDDEDCGERGGEAEEEEDDWDALCVASARALFMRPFPSG